MLTPSSSSSSWFPSSSWWSWQACIQTSHSGQLSFSCHSMWLCSTSLLGSSSYHSEPSDLLPNRYVFDSHRGRSIMRCATPLWLWLLPFPWCVSCSTQSPACDETRLLQTAAAIQPLPAFFSVPKVMVFYNLYLGSSTAEMMKFKFSDLVFGCITFSQCAKKLELIPTRFKDSSDAPQDIKRTFLGSPKSCGSSCLISTQRHKNFGWIPSGLWQISRT